MCPFRKLDFVFEGQGGRVGGGCCRCSGSALACEAKILIYIRKVRKGQKLSDYIGTESFLSWKQRCYMLILNIFFSRVCFPLRTLRINSNLRYTETPPLPRTWCIHAGNTSAQINVCRPPQTALEYICTWSDAYLWNVCHAYPYELHAWKVHTA